MFDDQMFFPIIGQGFVKFTIFLLTNIVRVASPDGFGFVQLLIFNIFFLDGLFLLFIFVSFVFILIFTNVFNFRFITLFLFLYHFIIIGFVIRYFLVALFLNQKFDGIANELGVLFHNLFDLFLLFIFNLIFFQVKNNFGTTTDRFAISICFDGERSTG